jgi:hypothetical protein
MEKDDEDTELVFFTRLFGDSHDLTIYQPYSQAHRYNY